MIDILKRIAVGIVVGMSIFFLKTEVFALETDSFQVYNGNKSGSFGMTQQTINSRGYVNLPFDYNYTNTVGYDYLQLSIALTFTLSGPASSSQFLAYPFVVGAYIVGNDTTAYCQATYSSISCPIKKDSTYSRITIFVMYPSNGNANITLGYFVDQRVMVYASEIKQGVQESIDQQTDDILDSDSPASKEYNNDYSTTSYDTAESNMNQNLDQDVSGFTFNPLSWSHSFSFIWDTVTDLVQINSKVFLMITTFLTFSFVGLVIGRS